MINQVTTVEQSKRLLNLGVPAEKASMFWVRGIVMVDANGDNWYGNWELSLNREKKFSLLYGAEVCPAFTLIDLMEIIGEPDGYTFYITRWDEDYAVELAGYKPLFFRNENILYSAFQMVERLYKDGRVK